MSDSAELLLVFVALYLIECASWTRRSCLGLLRTWGRIRIWAAPEVLGNPEAGFVFGNPLPPLGDLFVIPSWPCALAPMGLSSRSPLSVDPLHRQSRATSVVTFEDCASLDAEDAKLQIEGRTWLHAGSSSMALKLAQLSTRLKSAEESERANLIHEALDQSLDAKQIEDRLERFEKALKLLAPACWALFFVIFGLAPITVWRLGLERTWISLLCVLVPSWWLVVGLFVRSHKRLYPDSVGERRLAMFMMGLLPMAALRARDHLARKLLDGLDPVLCIAVLVGQSEAPTVRAAPVHAAQRALAFPLGNAERDTQVDAWFRKAYRERLNRALSGLGFKEADALSAPEVQSGNSLYCPRCHDQFGDEAEACHACENRALEAFLVVA